MRKRTRIESLRTLFRERKWRPTYLSLALSLALTSTLPPTHAQTDERSGAQIVAAQCVKCHGEGLNGAPKIGDREAWGQRIAKNVGFENLVRSAIRGYGGMPPRGDQANLTDRELRSAIHYMYNPAGAVAKPISEVARPVGAGPFPGALTSTLPPTHAQTDERSGAQIVAAQCVKCHGEGLNGAPKIGDREAWGQRIAKNFGFENLVRSAIRGYGGMPPRGDQANLTDRELRSAIQYMYNPAGAAGQGE